MYICKNKNILPLVMGILLGWSYKVSGRVNVLNLDAIVAAVVRGS